MPILLDVNDVAHTSQWQRRQEIINFVNNIKFSKDGLNSGPWIEI